jgi:S-adenosyl-L-methionine hydrolase (adenosine-forming)
MSSERPIIGFLTDFGLDGAAATCHGVMLSICPDAQIIDISHAVPKYGVAAGAFVLSAALPYLPVGVHVGVVDPGVGTERRPIAIRTARGDVLVGPDNGLLIGPAEALGGIDEVRELTNAELWLPARSSTFHGRDIFAPTAAHLAKGAATFEEVGPALDAAALLRLPEPAARVRDGALETEVTYVDSFGNVRLAAGRAELEQLGWASFGRGAEIRIGGGNVPLTATFVQSFGAVATGAALLYLDSSGNLALAENRGNLAERIGAAMGDVVVIRPYHGPS